jgi:Primosomal protein N'' (replication factor Y) - superfamily II helicase
LNFRNYLNKIAYHLRDSHGFDKFSKYLVITGFIFSAVRYTTILGYVLIVYGIWRSVSKNRYKRQRELLAFESYLFVIKQKFYRYKSSILEFRQYKIFKCPNCSQKLRVPRKKGKLVITCKKCGAEFKGKS